MSVFATEGKRFSAVFKHEYDPAVAYCRESVTLNDTTNLSLTVGAVLGKVTATGKYKLSLSAASDGSQTPAAILMGGVDGSDSLTLVSGTDAKAVVAVRGPVIVAGEALTIGTGHTIATVKAALLAAGVLVETSL